MKGSEIFQIVVFVEARRTTFAVSRLIMMSGVSVRKYQKDSVDHPQDLRKVRSALRALLDDAEIVELDDLLAR